MNAETFTVEDALFLMQKAGWLERKDSSSDFVHTLQSRAGDQTLIIVGSPDSPISGEAVDRIKDRAIPFKPATAP